MLYSLSDNGDFSVARGYAVDIPVSIRKPTQDPYQMLPGDKLIFIVKRTLKAQTAMLRKEFSEPVLSLSISDTMDLNFGSYVFFLVLKGAKGWTETILGPCQLRIGGDDDALLDEYRRLLTSEYKTRPKLTAWLLWLLSEGVTDKTLLTMMQQAFALDTAVGAQLDVLGQIVGVRRILSFYPADGSGPIMNDQTYRKVIRARLIQNMWKGTLPELYQLWATIFPEIKYFQVQDLQNMTFNVVIMGELPPLDRELIRHGYIIPKPEGVRINMLTITDLSGLPIFAYDVDTHQQSGYTAHWTELE